MTMERMMEKWGGGEILRRAVSGMLPKNRLRKVRLARLRTFEGAAHPYRENIVRVGRSRVVDMPQVKSTLQRARDEAITSQTVR
jgi:large subunit ribosomal protein L13